MKRLLALAILAVPLLVQQSVSAATIYLKWADDPDSTRDFYPNDQADVELWVDLLAGEALAGIAFSHTALGDVWQTQTVVHPQGWADISTNGPLDGASQYAAYSATPGANLLGPQSVKIGMQTLLLDACEPGNLLPITFDHANVSVLNEFGGGFTWNAWYNTTYSGFVAYGDYGNPGWNTKMGSGQPTPNPSSCDA